MAANRCSGVLPETVADEVRETLEALRDASRNSWFEKYRGDPWELILLALRFLRANADSALEGLDEE